MSKKVNRDQLVQLLPENFSDETILEVQTLVESTIEDRVSEVEKQLVTRFNSFISENIESLKEVAIKELEADNDILRQAKLFESVKQLVRDELVDDDVQQLLEAKDEQIKELEEALVELKDYIDDLENKNSALHESLEAVAYEPVDENEDNDEALKGKAIIVSESEESDVPADESVTEEDQYEENEFLSESVMSILKPRPKFSDFIKENQ